MANSIPKEIKTSVLKIVDDFNKNHNTAFKMTFRGRFAYLAKTENQQIDITKTFYEMIMKKLKSNKIQIAQQNAPIIESKLGRLKYNNKMDNWSFAVYKYSRENYDENAFMFPGFNKLDGTIEGALRAGLELY